MAQLEQESVPGDKSSSSFAVAQMGDAASEPAPPSPDSSESESAASSPNKSFGSQTASQPMGPHQIEPHPEAISLSTPSPMSVQGTYSAKGTNTRRSRSRGESFGLGGSSRRLEFNSPTKVKKNINSIKSALKQIFQSSRGREILENLTEAQIRSIVGGKKKTKKKTKKRRRRRKKSKKHKIKRKKKTLRKRRKYKKTKRKK